MDLHFPSSSSTITSTRPRQLKGPKVYDYLQFMVMITVVMVGSGVMVVSMPPLFHVVCNPIVFGEATTTTTILPTNIVSGYTNITDCVLSDEYSDTTLDVATMAFNASAAGNTTIIFELYNLYTNAIALVIDCGNGLPWAYGIPLKVKIVNGSNAYHYEKVFELLGSLEMGSTIDILGGSYKTGYDNLYFFSIFSEAKILNGSAVRIVGNTFTLLSPSTSSVIVTMMSVSSLQASGNGSVLEYANNNHYFKVMSISQNAYTIRLVSGSCFNFSDGAEVRVVNNNLEVQDVYFIDNSAPFTFTGVNLRGCQSIVFYNNATLRMSDNVLRMANVEVGKVVVHWMVTDKQSILDFGATWSIERNSALLHTVRAIVILTARVIALSYSITMVNNNINLLASSSSPPSQLFISGNGIDVFNCTSPEVIVMIFFSPSGSLVEMSGLIIVERSGISAVDLQGVHIVTIQVFSSNILNLPTRGVINCNANSIDVSGPNITGTSTAAVDILASVAVLDFPASGGKVDISGNTIDVVGATSTLVSHIANFAPTTNLYNTTVSLLHNYLTGTPSNTFVISGGITTFMNTTNVCNNYVNGARCKVVSGGGVSGRGVGGEYAAICTSNISALVPLVTEICATRTPTNTKASSSTSSLPTKTFSRSSTITFSDTISPSPSTSSTGTISSSHTVSSSSSLSSNITTSRDVTNTCSKGSTSTSHTLIETSTDSLTGNTLSVTHNTTITAASTTPSKSMPTTLSQQSTTLSPTTTPPPLPLALPVTASPSVLTASEQQAVTVVSALSPDLQTVAAMALLRCSSSGGDPLHVETEATIRALVPVALSGTCAGAVQGAILAVMVVGLLCALAAAILMKIRKVGWMDAAAVTRCSGAALGVWAFLQMGFVVCGARLVTTPSGSGSDVALGVIGVLLGVTLPVLSVVLAQFVIARRCYRIGPTRVAVASSSRVGLWVRSMLLPEYELDMEGVPSSKAYSALVGRTRLVGSIWAAVPMSQPVIMLVVVFVQGVGCSAVLITAGVMTLLVAAVCQVWYRPHRIHAANYIQGLTTALNAAVLIIGAKLSSSPFDQTALTASRTVSMIQLVLTVLRIGHGVLGFIYMMLWRRTVFERVHPDGTRYYSPPPPLTQHHAAPDSAATTIPTTITTTPIGGPNPVFQHLLPLTDHTTRALPILIPLIIHTLPDREEGGAASKINKNNDHVNKEDGTRYCAPTIISPSTSSSPDHPTSYASAVSHRREDTSSPRFPTTTTHALPSFLVRTTSKNTRNFNDDIISTVMNNHRGYIPMERPYSLLWQEEDDDEDIDGAIELVSHRQHNNNSGGNNNDDDDLSERDGGGSLSSTSTTALSSPNHSSSSSISPRGRLSSPNMMGSYNPYDGEASTSHSPSSSSSL